LAYGADESHGMILREATRDLNSAKMAVQR